MAERTEPLQIVLNPTSGSGAGARVRPELERTLARAGLMYELQETTGPGSARAIARAVAADGRIVVAAGGDGTIHEVANGILDSGTDAVLALVPVGTGNDLVKVVPGNRTRLDAYATLQHGRPVRYDVGRVTWPGGSEHFINGMGTGIDVEVVRQLQSVPAMPGALKYLVGLLRALVRYKPVALALRFDDLALERKVMIIALGNGVCQGGGFYLAPGASPTDGRLDLTVVDALGLASILPVLVRILRGTQAGHPAVLMRAGHRLELRSTDGRALFFHLDGELREPAGAQTLTAEVVPAALAVLSRV